MRKRLVSALTVIALSTSFMPVVGFAENDEDAISIGDLSAEVLQDESDDNAIAFSQDGEEQDSFDEDLAQDGDVVESDEADDFDAALMAEENTYGSLKYTVSGTNVTITGCDTSVTSVSIPAQIDGMDVTAIGTSAFYGCSKITDITIPATVTNIGYSGYSNKPVGVFGACIGLKAINVASKNKNYSSHNGILYNKDITELIHCPVGKTGTIKIPYGVRSIGSNAFDQCKGIIGVEIPESVETIGAYAFRNCLGLTDIDITYGITTIEEAAFAYCSNLTTVQISESVQSIGSSAFAYCIKLDYINIPDSVVSIDHRIFDTCISLKKAVLGRGITKIPYGMFSDCTALDNIEILGDVTEIDTYAFRRCAHLINFDMPSGLIIIGDSAFSGCSSLNITEIPYGVTNIGDYAFRNCSNLHEISIPKSVASIGESAFEACTFLREISIPYSVSYIGSYAFAECSRLLNIDVDIENAQYCSIDGILYNKEKTKLMQYPGGKAGQCDVSADVTEISRYAFSGAGELVSINVDSDNTLYSSYDGVLFNKDETELLRFPGGKTGDYMLPESVEKINSAFASCKDVSLTIPKPDKISDLNGVTMRGNGLSRINVSEDSQLYSSQDGVLFNKDKTELICYPGSKEGIYVIPETVKIIGFNSFYGNKTLTGIEFSSSVTSISASAFGWCTGLSELNIPDNVTEIGSYAFMGCRGLKKLKLSGSVETIDMDVFQQIGVEHLEIPEGVKKLELGSFSFCRNLKSLVIPKSVEYIGEWAFQDATALTDVYYDGTEQEWNKIRIRTSNNYVQDAVIHYNAIGIAPPTITSVRLLSSGSAGNSIGVSLADTEYDSELMTVFYKDGQMVDVKITTISAGDDIANITVAEETEADEAKVFIWSSIDRMKPLCEAKTIEL